MNTKFIARRAYWEGRAKVILNKMYRPSDRTVLAAEYGLLRRIFFRLLPGELVLLFYKPVVALRQLWVTFLVLAGVAFGYFSGALHDFSRPR